MAENDPECRNSLSWMESRVVEIQTKLKEVEIQQRKLPTLEEFKRSNRVASLESMAWAWASMGICMFAIGVTILFAPGISESPGLRGLADEYILIGFVVFLVSAILALFHQRVRGLASELLRHLGREKDVTREQAQRELTDAMVDKQRAEEGFREIASQYVCSEAAPHGQSAPRLPKLPTADAVNELFGALERCKMGDKRLERALKNHKSYTPGPDG